MFQVIFNINNIENIWFENSINTHLADFVYRSFLSYGLLSKSAVKQVRVFYKVWSNEVKNRPL